MLLTRKNFFDAKKDCILQKKTDLIRFKKEREICTDSITDACTDAERKMFFRVKLKQI